MLRFCAKWEGEGDVDYDMFAKECKVERRHSGKDVSERHHPSRAELGPMPTWVVRMVTGRVLGSGRWPGEGLAQGCSMFSRMLKQGPLGWCWPYNTVFCQHHYEVLAIWLRARLS